MKVLVCGGRDFNDYDLVERSLTQLCFDRGWYWEPDDLGNWLPSITIIHGAARGADTLANRWAVMNWCDQMQFPADWSTHGKKAGPVPNQQMLYEKPDLVVAFPAGAARRTWCSARKAGVEVIEFS